jgi:hypothetical protein
MKTKENTVAGRGCFLCRASAERLLVFGANVAQVLARGAVASLPWATCPAAVGESPCLATWLMSSPQASRPSAVSAPQSHLNQFKRSGTLGRTFKGARKWQVSFGLQGSVSWHLTRA